MKMIKQSLIYIQQYVSSLLLKDIILIKTWTPVMSSKLATLNSLNPKDASYRNQAIGIKPTFLSS